MPFRTLALVTALLHLYIGVRLVPALMAWPLLAGLVGLALVVSTVAVPTPFLRSAAKAPMAAGWRWLCVLAMGWFSSLTVLTLLRELSLLGAWAFGLLSGWGPWSAAAVVAGASAASLLGFINARRTATVRHVDVVIRGLPAGLKGFLIAQLSDLHVGPTIRRGYLERIVARVNGLHADVVAITGDLVDGSVAELREHTAPLAELRSRHGSFVVTGNHEYYAGADAWVAELRRLGLVVLMNQHVLLRPGPAASGPAPADECGPDALLLAGVTDFHAGHFDASHTSDPALALAGAPAHVTARVLMAHQPRSSAAAAEAGFQLQLSGHTHGGQFWPWNLFVPMQQPFVAGLHRVHDLWVYVSRGTGYWGPPKRLGAPSEITLLRLLSAD